MKPPVTVSRMTDDIFLQTAADCVTRPQKDGMMFYNPRTDELHLVPAGGSEVCRLCNELYSVGEIEALLIAGHPQQAALIRATLWAFIGSMLARGLLEHSHVT